MHKRRADFDPLKFTPSRIHNKIEIDIEELRRYFEDDHPLDDCATRYGCSKSTIKRKLRAAGIDTSRYNHTTLAVSRRKSPTLSDDEIKKMYIDDNLDTKTIAELLGVHFNTIRKRVRRMKLRKNRKDVSRSMMSRHHRMHGCSHPAQRADVLAKTRKSSQRAEYESIQGTIHNFRSLHELSFALLLDNDGVEWSYEEMRVPYTDMMTGKQRIYIIDFTTVSGDIVSWIEVKPNNNMIPIDKRIFASRRAEEAGVEFRGLTDLERSRGWELLCSGYRADHVEFTYPTPRSSASQISLWFRNRDDAEAHNMPGWYKHIIVSHSDHLHTLKLRRSCK